MRTKAVAAVGLLVVGTVLLVGPAQASTNGAPGGAGGSAPAVGEVCVFGAAVAPADGDKAPDPAWQPATPLPVGSGSASGGAVATGGTEALPTPVADTGTAVAVRVESGSAATSVVGTPGPGEIVSSFTVPTGGCGTMPAAR